jgi:uncharacterized protein (DUF488 family)
MARAELITVGHSTHALDEFLGLLAGAGVELVADVRRFPGSRRHPHFASAALAVSLADAGIGYEHLPELGGRRAVTPDSPNDGWQVAAFRGYADHLRTSEFATGKARLAGLAAERRTVIMCAEALPWRCHRRLIADVFVLGGWQVLDLMPAGHLEQHRLPGFARRAEDGLPLYATGGEPLFGGVSVSTAEPRQLPAPASAVDLGTHPSEHQKPARLGTVP